MKKLVLSFVTAAAVILLGTPSANAYSYSYYSLSEASNESFLVGDEMQVQSEFCWTNAKQDPKYPSKREAKINGVWKSVGTSKFKKDKSVCSKSAFPYLKIFVWKLNQSGTFQLRNREKNPSINVSITVESKVSSTPSSAPTASGGSTTSGGSTASGIDRASCSFKGQKLYGRVFITDREIFSDFTVYITDREIFSDLTVFKSDREIFANRCGLWFITDREIFSDFTIYLTDREIFSDFTIYLTDREIFAGVKR